MTAVARPELVIFDCDGVLVDSERLTVEIEVEILAELGLVMTPSEVSARFLGINDADYVAIIEAELGRKLPEGWLEEVSLRLRRLFSERLEEIPNIRGALTALAEAGVTSCVASSGSHEKIRHSLGITELADFFGERIFSAEDVERGKPAPDLFLHAASTLGCRPDECVVVEDSPFGLQGALAAGMRAIAYEGGLIPRRRLEQDGVTVISDMAELAELIFGPQSERRAI